MPEKLLLPLLTLLGNALITYGVISTQLQWIRTDLDRQQKQIARIENRLFWKGKYDEETHTPTQCKRPVPPAQKVVT